LTLQVKSREKSSAVVVQPGFALVAGPYIAILIEKRKRVAVFQHPDALIGEAGIGEDVMRIPGTRGSGAGVVHPRAF